MLRRLIHRYPLRTRPTLVRHTSYSLLVGPTMAMYGLTSFVAYKALGASQLEVAVLAAALPMGHLLAVLWAGQVTARRKVEFVFWPQVVAAVVLMTVAWIRSSALFTLVICLTMLVRAPVTSAIIGITRVNYPPQWRSSILAMASGGGTVSAALFAALAGQVLDWSPNSFRMLFPVAAAIGIIGAWQFRKVRVSGEGRADSPARAAAMPFRRVLAILVRDRGFRRYQYSFFIFGFANIMLLPVFPVFLEEEFRAPYLDASLAIVTIPTVLSLVFLPLWGRLLDTRNPLLLRFLANLASIVFPLCCFSARGMGLIFIGRAVQGIVTGGSGLIWLLGVNYFARKTEVPAYMALHQTLTGVRGLLAPFVGTWMMGMWGARVTFLACAGMMLVGSLFMLWEVLREWNANGLRTYSQAELDSDRSAVGN